MKTLRAVLAWIATISWTVGWIAYLVAHPSEGPLDPNEMGDFLAGVTAPVAFLWLIVGYFQQGDELRQNTKALRLQERELKKQARALRQQASETKRLVSVTSKQAESTIRSQEFDFSTKLRNAQPVFQDKGRRRENERIIVAIGNVGAHIRQVETVYEGDLNVLDYSTESLPSNSKLKFIVEAASGISDGPHGTLRVFFRDSNGHSQEVPIDVVMAKGAISLKIPKDPDLNLDIDRDLFAEYKAAIALSQ